MMLILEMKTEKPGESEKRRNSEQEKKKRRDERRDRERNIQWKREGKIKN